MSVRIRFRTDSAFLADDAARLARGEETQWFTPDELQGAEPAVPGDCWRCFWLAGAFAGYAICCLKCLQVHHWTTATNCVPCPHESVGSCWTWTGSAEDGTLTASPSLHCVAESGGCGYHGWLQNGVLSDG